MGPSNSHAKCHIFGVAEKEFRFTRNNRFGKCSWSKFPFSGYSFLSHTHLASDFRCLCFFLP